MDRSFQLDLDEMMRRIIAFGDPNHVTGQLRYRKWNYMVSFSASKEDRLAFLEKGFDTFCMVFCQQCQALRPGLGVE